MDESANTSDAPRCPTCGYLLLGLTESRCPECGTPFDPEYVEGGSFRIHLLPWERPEVGGWAGRLARTLVQALLHPGRFFTSLSKRKDRPVANAGMLITACVLVSLCFHAAAYLLNYAVRFIHLLVKYGQPSRALDSTVRVFSLDWPADLTLSLMRVLSVLLPVVVIAVLIGRVFRSKLGSLGTLDIAAVHSPAVVLGTLIAVLGQVVLAVSFQALLVVVVGMVLTLMILPLLVWFSCRRLLLLNRWKTVGMLIVVGGIQYGCETAVTRLLFWALLLIVAPES